MRAGLLRHPVDIVLPKQGARDAYNVPTDVADVVGQAWARIEQLSGEEYLAAQQIQAGITTKVTVRFEGEITTRHRLRRKDGTELEVVAPLDESGRGIMRVLMCREAA
jgi:SPP1 family predicted phage head-tail adaptor